MNLRDQIVFTANALRNIADIASIQPAISEALHSHADDLMRAVSMEKSTDNLPAAAVSRQPSDNPETIIWWWNPLRCEKDHEVFGSLTVALAELEDWKVRFPWNTYRVATEILTHLATEEWKDPRRAHSRGARGSATPQADSGNAASSRHRCVVCGAKPGIIHHDDPTHPTRIVLLRDDFHCQLCAEGIDDIEAERLLNEEIQREESCVDPARK